jgi:hypothetical protein
MESRSSRGPLAPISFLIRNGAACAGAFHPSIRRRNWSLDPEGSTAAACRTPLGAAGICTASVGTVAAIANHELSANIMICPLLQ